MKKILVLSRRSILDALSGGASRYIHEILRRLTDEFDVTVVSEGPETNGSTRRISEVKYVSFPGVLTRVRLPISYLTRFARETDILIDHGDVGIPWLSPLFSRKPKITVIHQLVRDVFHYELPQPLSTFCLLSERAVYKVYTNSRIVVPSRSTSEDLVEFGIPRERIHVIPPGCSNRNARRVPLSERSPRLICCVSRLMHYKGLQFALRSFAQLSKEFPDARMAIAGIGPYGEELLSLAHRLGIEKSVNFLGRISEEAKFGLYGKSRTVVMPSIKEGYGMAVIEANSVGTPVVGWDVSGVRDSIVDTETGLLAHFPDQSELATQVGSLLTDDSIWDRLSEGAWKWAQKHSWDESAEGFRAVLREAISNAT